ncbi:MAG: hypothetical protein ACE5HI_04820 [bacterium]
MKFSKVNDDMLCATSDWLYMTYRRLGQVEEAEKVLAAIHKDMEIFVNHQDAKHTKSFCKWEIN